MSRFRLRRASSRRRARHRGEGESETFRGYAPERGYAFLLEAVARRYASLGVSLDEDEIFISDGAKSDAGNIADILGDSPVYIPDPVYPVYADSSILAGRRVRMIEGTRENLFLPMPDGIAESGAVFFICSPNNPTGAVYSRKQLEKWVDFARETGSLIIYDSHTNRSSSTPHSIYEIGEQTMRGKSLAVKWRLHRIRCAWTVAVRTFANVCERAWAKRRATNSTTSYLIQRARNYAFRRGTRGA
ncbi:MAG: aminotransferase class I/II-fold pyridoxal phosphate-dependent enzyme [Lachnospiraceae bacterium]